MAQTRRPFKLASACDMPNTRTSQALHLPKGFTNAGVPGVPPPKLNGFAAFCALHPGAPPYCHTAITLERPACPNWLGRSGHASPAPEALLINHTALGNCSLKRSGTGHWPNSMPSCAWYARRTVASGACASSIAAACSVGLLDRLLKQRGACRNRQILGFLRHEVPI